MNRPFPDDPIPPEWLAAYADNELHPALRRQVERQLSQRRDLLAELHRQRDLSANNATFRQAIAPPNPSAETWEATLTEIVRALPPAVARGRSRWKRYAITGTAAAAAAILVLVATVEFQRGGPPLVETRAAVSTASAGSVTPAVDEDLVYPVARADDVELIELPEAAAALVVVGRHPMQGVPLLLAQADDLHLINFGPDDHGNLPDIATTWGPEPPTLWAPPTDP